jgi:hypothetical protein
VHGHEKLISAEHLQKSCHTGALCVEATRMSESAPEHGRIQCASVCIIAYNTIATGWCCEWIELCEEARQKLMCGFGSSPMASSDENTVTFSLPNSLSRYGAINVHKLFVEYLDGFRRPRKTVDQFPILSRVGNPNSTLIFSVLFHRY